MPMKSLTCAAYGSHFMRIESSVPVPNQTMEYLFQ
jgi:hypothetical protein